MMLLVVFLLCLAYDSVQGSLVGKTPEELLSPYASEGPAALLRSFTIDLENLRALSKILEYEEHDFYQYYSVLESPERTALFKQFARNEELHGTVFHYSKLQKNPEWYSWFFSAKTADVVEYKARLLKNIGLEINASEMEPEMVESIIMNQLSKGIPSSGWINDALWRTSDEFVLEIFSSFSMADITVELLGIFGVVKNERAILDNFLGRLEHLKDDKEKELYHVVLWCARYLHSAFANLDEELRLIPDVYNPKSFSREDALALLASMREGRTDKIFWSAYVGLVSDSWKREEESHILWVIENLPKNVASPTALDIIIFIYRSWELCSPQQRQSLIAIVPPEFRPEWFRPSDEMRAPWIRLRFTTDQEIRTVDDNFLSTFYKNASRGLIPEKLVLNFLYKDSNDFERIPLSDKLIKESMKIATSTEIYSNEDLVKMMVAWPYMIARGKKGDFSRLFPRKPTPKNWETVISQMPGGDIRSYQYQCVDFEFVLQFLGISSYFTPKQLRELIDSSYDPAEGQ